jgi:hypothetical protein
VRKELSNTQKIECSLSFLKIETKIELFGDEDVALSSIRGEELPQIEIKDSFYVNWHTNKKLGKWGIYYTTRTTHIPRMTQTTLEVNGRILWDKKE